MFIYNIGSPKHKNTYDFLVQVRNFLLLWSLKVFRHKERDTPDFSICSKTRAHPPKGHGEPAKVNLLLPTAKFNSLTFLKFPQILHARFRCMTSFTFPGHNFLSGIFILTSVNNTSSPRARQHLRSSFPLT